MLMLVIDSKDMSLSKLWELVMDREAWHATSMGLQSQTLLSDWTELNFPCYSWLASLMNLYCMWLCFGNSSGKKKQKDDVY